MTDARKLQLAVFRVLPLFHDKFTQTPFQDDKYIGLQNCVRVPPPPPFITLDFQHALTLLLDFLFLGLKSYAIVPNPTLQLLLCYLSG